MQTQQNGINHPSSSLLTNISEADFKQLRKKLAKKTVKIMRKRRKKVVRRVRIEGVLAIFFKNAEALYDAYDPADVEFIEDGVKRGICG